MCAVHSSPAALEMRPGGDLLPLGNCSYVEPGKIKSKRVPLEYEPIISNFWWPYHFDALQRGLPLRTKSARSRIVVGSVSNNIIDCVAELWFTLEWQCWGFGINLTKRAGFGIFARRPGSVFVLQESDIMVFRDQRKLKTKCGDSRYQYLMTERLFNPVIVYGIKQRPGGRTRKLKGFASGREARKSEFVWHRDL